jgi:hypothetical protein
MTLRPMASAAAQRRSSAGCCSRYAARHLPRPKHEPSWHLPQVSSVYGPRQNRRESSGMYGILVGTVSVKGSEMCQVSKLVNSDTYPRPAA